MPTHKDDYDLSAPTREELVDTLRRNGYRKVDIVVRFRMEEDVEPYIFRKIMNYLYAKLRGEIAEIEDELNK